MAETKRHPQHPGGAWPLNVEMSPAPIVTVNAMHPDDAEKLKKEEEERVIAARMVEAGDNDVPDPAVVRSNPAPAKGSARK